MDQIQEQIQDDVIMDQEQCPFPDADVSTGKQYQAKTLALTYPRCPIDKEEAAKQLHTALDTYGIKVMVIVQETHKDLGKHLHCYVELNSKYTNRGAHNRLYLN